MEEDRLDMMDRLCRFKIGDTVAMIGRQMASSNSKDRNRWSSENEMRFRVVARRIDECYGGIQVHYTIRGITKLGNFGDLLNVLEIEVERMEPFNPRLENDSI